MTIPVNELTGRAAWPTLREDDVLWRQRHGDVEERSVGAGVVHPGRRLKTPDGLRIDCGIVIPETHPVRGMSGTERRYEHAYSAACVLARGFATHVSAPLHVFWRYGRKLHALNPGVRFSVSDCHPCDAEAREGERAWVMQPGMEWVWPQFAEQIPPPVFAFLTGGRVDASLGFAIYRNRRKAMASLNGAVNDWAAAESPC